MLIEPEEGPEPTDGETFRSINGFDLSTVTVFLSLIPLWMSPKSASLPPAIAGGEDKFGTPAAGGGGGGGGGGPAMFVCDTGVVSGAVKCGGS